MIVLLVYLSVIKLCFDLPLTGQEGGGPWVLVHEVLSTGRLALSGPSLLHTPTSRPAFRSLEHGEGGLL